jgi:hypothetical protein
MVCYDLIIVFTAELAENAETLFFAFAAERTANANPQPLRGVMYIPLVLL